MSAPLRPIVSRLRGTRHGPITRLISPHEAGELLKPFVFLDFFDADIQPGFGFGMHPHSGIATLTWQPGCDVQYEDTTGQKGLLKAGGLEWMNAGGGAWHQASLVGADHATGFQLWVAMPPGVEDGPGLGQYVPPAEVAVAPVAGGEVRVLLGSLDASAVAQAGGPAGGTAVQSTIASHQDMNYFVVTLEAGASWVYQPPLSHDVAWAFGFAGTPLVQGEPNSKELFILGSDGAIKFDAGAGACKVLAGSARRHNHDLVTGPSSVHTNAASLAQGAARIRSIGAQLQAQGRLR